MNSKKELLMLQLMMEGFAFFQLQIPEDLKKKVLNIQFDYHPAEPGDDTTWVVQELPDALDRDLRKWLKSTDELKDLVDELTFDAHTFTKGEYLKIHNDTKDKGAYQLLIWVCENDKFRGRDFLYGIKLEEKEEVKSKRVNTGLACLMDINNENFVHGVSKLETETKIVTVQGFHKN